MPGGAKTIVVLTSLPTIRLGIRLTERMAKGKVISLGLFIWRGRGRKDSRTRKDRNSSKIQRWDGSKRVRVSERRGKEEGHPPTMTSR